MQWMMVYFIRIVRPIAVIFLSGIFLISVVEAYEIQYLKAEVFKIPSYNSRVPSGSFIGIGIDGKTGNVCLANGYGWCEIPYGNGKFNFKSSFIAPTKGYKLKAVAGSPTGTYVFDTLSNSIMAERGNYKVSIRIDSPTGMAYHKGKLYVADKSTNKIYELQLTGGRAKVLRIFKAHNSICGLASDGNFLYSCDSRNIYKYDSNMKVTFVYKLKVSIAGIAFSGPGEILAVARNKNEIYKFRLKHR